MFLSLIRIFEFPLLIVVYLPQNMTESFQAMKQGIAFTLGECAPLRKRERWLLYLLLQWKMDKHVYMFLWCEALSFWLTNWYLLFMKLHCICFGRTHFEHQGKDVAELSFTIGDIFHIKDTLFRGVVGSWLAMRIGRNNVETQKGFIPNRNRSVVFYTVECK